MPSLVSKNNVGVSKAAYITGLEYSLKGGNTAIIGDTLHFETLGVHDLNGTTVNPKNIIAHISERDIFYYVWAAAKQTIDERISRGIPDTDLTKATLERMLFELGSIILDKVQGPHFTFVDPRRHNNASAMIKNARRLVSLYEEKGISRGKIVISIPATQEGVAAVRELESKHKIHTNLYLVSGLLHAAACAEAGATTITIPVGRLLNWHERKRKTVYEDLHAHPGIETIQSTLAYFKLHGIKTKVIGSEFRTLSEIGPLGDFDAICISKDQADHLRWSQTPISTPLANSPASLRARQAQYPTTLLESKSGFMNVMSAETRNMMATILFATLGEMKVQMDNLEEIVRKEVIRQFDLQTLDLRSLYRFSTPKSKKRSHTPGDVHLIEGRTVKPTLAWALGLGDSALGCDEDEVF